MSDLKEQLIKLGSKREDLREHITPILERLDTKTASRDGLDFYLRLGEDAFLKAVLKQVESKASNYVRGQVRNTGRLVYLDLSGVDKSDFEIAMTVYCIVGGKSGTFVRLRVKSAYKGDFSDDVTGHMANITPDAVARRILEHL